MASKKQKDKNRFPENLVREWENSDGVNFAIALSRISGWLLHVDWFTPYEDAPYEEMKPLRVYVGTDGDAIFDCNGKKRINAYNQYVILPLAKKRAAGQAGNVLTRFYSEDALWQLPLYVKPNETSIQIAIEAIKKNKKYLERIPHRINPEIPADRAAYFSFGHCVPFAAALQEIKGLPAVAIMVDKYQEAFSLTKTGYCHSVVLHQDGEAEDSWGKQPLTNILARFGIMDYRFSEEMQKEYVVSQQRNSIEKYQMAYQEALNLLAQYKNKSYCKNL